MSFLWVIFMLLYGACYTCGQQCPKNWVDFKDCCYRFMRIPLQTHNDAEDRCKTFNSDLVAVNSLEEHRFIINWLRENDPQHRRWYTSGREDGDNVWIWEMDGTLFNDINALFLPRQNISHLHYAAYNYSELANKWGLQKVEATELLAYICEINQENLHQIITYERDIDYGIIMFDKTKIPRGPRFIHEPEPVIFDFASRNQVDDVSLKCLAEGYPSVLHKWYKKEFRNTSVSEYIDPLSDFRYTQTDGTLIIHDPQQNKDHGNYHCTAENEYGSIVSRTVPLRFVYIEEFSKHRSADRGKKNHGKSLLCNPPQHYHGVHFYWVRNTLANFVGQDPRVFTSNDGNLYFSSLENGDEATYSCNIRSTISPSERKGPFFQLYVEPSSSTEKLFFPNNFPKSFPNVPLAGEDVRLECVAYGYPVPSYNWTRKSFFNKLPQGAYTQSFNRVLILPKVKVEDAGDYFCTASTNFDSITKSVFLDIQAKPKFTIPLDNKVMDKNSCLVWTCEAFGKPEVAYTWLKNGKELLVQNLNPNDRVRYHIYQNILTIDEVLERDQGMYQCKASNQLGSAYSSGELRVIALKPSFAKYPLDNEMFAAENGNVTIPCRPEAAPFPEFIWKHNNVSLSTEGRIEILSNGYLRINPLRKEDGGRYTCIAKNLYGSDFSEGLLTVLSMPQMVDNPPPRVEAVVNNSTELPCRAYVSNDMLDLAYTWHHNGIHINYTKQTQFSVGKYPGYLKISNITLAEAGVYQCIVKTRIGTISKSTQLVVFGPPGAPGAVLAQNLTATSGKIHWSDGSANGDPITRYTIEGSTNHNSSWVILEENITTFDNCSDVGRREVYLFNVLSPWSIYSFRVSAINSFGKGEASQPSPHYSTAKDIPHVAPSNVGGGGGTIGTMQITWNPLSPQDWNDEKIWYNISYKPADSDSKFREISLKRRQNIGLQVVKVGYENYYKPYLVKVQAINSLGPGPYSEEVKIYSAEKYPNIYFTQLNAFAYNSTALNVTWVQKEPYQNKDQEHIIGHRIKYWQSRKNVLTDSFTFLKRNLQSWSLIVGLKPNTEYFVVVMAYNQAGTGVESDLALSYTFKAAPPNPPTSIQIGVINDSSVLVSWKGVLTSESEEPIKGYKVLYWVYNQDMSSAKEVIQYLGTNNSTCIVSNLTPGRVYKLRVLAFSDGGDGKMSSPVREFKIA